MIRVDNNEIEIKGTTMEIMTNIADLMESLKGKIPERFLRFAFELGLKEDSEKEDFTNEKSKETEMEIIKNLEKIKKIFEDFEETDSEEIEE